MSDIDREIAPSVTGLSNLYRWLHQRDRHSFVENFVEYECQAARQTALVFYVLSGLFVDLEQNSTPSTKYLAMAGAGVCVYRQALEDPKLPPDSIFRFRVVPGYVSHAGAIFKRIRNLSGLRNPPSFRFNASMICQSVDAIVQETDRDSELAMAYQVDCDNGRGKRKYLFLSVGRLLYNLQNSVIAFKCEGGCLNLPTKSQRKVKSLDVNEETSLWQDTRRYPLIFFDQAATGDAQRFIASLSHSSNLWIRTCSDAGARDVKHHPREMLIDRPFMIYLSLMDSSYNTLRVFRFVPCLSCIIERGCLAKFYNHRDHNPPSTGSVWLVSPGVAERELLWETLEPNSVQETVTVTK